MRIVLLIVVVADVLVLRSYPHLSGSGSVLNSALMYQIGARYFIDAFGGPAENQQIVGFDHFES